MPGAGTLNTSQLGATVTVKRVVFIALLAFTITAQAEQKALVCTDDRVDAFISESEARLADRRAMDNTNCDASPLAKRRCQVQEALTASTEELIDSCKDKPFVSRQTFVFDAELVDSPEPVEIEIIDEGCGGESQVYVGKMASTSSFLTFTWTITSSPDAPVQRKLSVSENVSRSTLKDSDGNQCVLEDREVKNQI